MIIKWVLALENGREPYFMRNFAPSCRKKQSKNSYEILENGSLKNVPLEEKDEENPRKRYS
jgi:hypothetical protein